MTESELRADLALVRAALGHGVLIRGEVAYSVTALCGFIDRVLTQRSKHVADVSGEVYEVRATFSRQQWDFARGRMADVQSAIFPERYGTREEAVSAAERLRAAPDCEAVLVTCLSAVFTWHRGDPAGGAAPNAGPPAVSS